MESKTNTISAISNVAKQFGDVVAVESVTFYARENERYDFPGPNGAGKTKTLNIPVGLAAFCVALFTVNLRNIQRKWVV